MKNFIYYFLGVLLLCSCQDHSITEEYTSSPNSVQKGNSNPVFLVFSSKSELTETISKMKEGNMFVATRTSNDVTDQAVEESSESIQFVSLLEANKREVMSSLSPEQLDSINNDEDDLEFCLSDSIIADYEFAQLLNASREIQVNDTVYKYYGNGVAFTEQSNADELAEIDSVVSSIPVTDETLGTSITINENITFVPYSYEEIEDSDKIVSTRSTSNREPLTLKNGVTIPSDDIRDIDYDGKGDGGWFHRTWNGLWGKNVLAINNFNGHKRLRLGFYDQNYIVYANIGTTMKMQKKVCGLWWNCKADEIRIGWSALELKYTFPSPVIKYFNPNVEPSKAVNTDYPSWLKHNFPFRNESSVLFYIPYTSYNIKVKDVNSLLKSGLKSILNSGTKKLKEYINSTPEGQRGLYAVDSSVLYVISGADEFEATKARTLTQKAYAKWFPGTYEVSFSYNGGFKLASVTMDGGTKTQLSSGTVYGAVKYKGKWLAARITKSKK